MNENMDEEIDIAAIDNYEVEGDEDRTYQPATESDAETEGKVTILVTYKMTANGVKKHHSRNRKHNVIEKETKKRNNTQEDYSCMEFGESYEEASERV